MSDCPSGLCRWEGAVASVVVSTESQGEITLAIALSLASVFTSRCWAAEQLNPSSSSAHAAAQLEPGATRTHSADTIGATAATTTTTNKRKRWIDKVVELIMMMMIMMMCEDTTGFW
jgi:hypothetical protein